MKKEFDEVAPPSTYRKSLSEIKQDALKRRKECNSADYEPDEENEFFKEIENQVYEQIVSEDDDW